jgi:antagonist of KipI
MSLLTIVRPGMFTTVQDSGRWGFQARGVPVSGAMDLYSHRLANRLIGNRDEAATFEVTLTGPQMEFDTPTAFAITGAEFRLTLDGRPIAMNQPIEGQSGSVLTFGERVRGARSYIAVAGGVCVPEVLRSRAAHVLSGMGGFDGRALRAGDRVPIAGRGASDPGSTIDTGSGSVVPLPVPEGGARVRVIPHPGSLLGQVAGRRFRVSPRSDRMGYRLEGSRVTGAPKGELISSAVPTGALQVPPTGEPILLMADHATTGGYAIAATVITADLPLAGQLAPGDWIEFEPCSFEAADAALREQDAALARSVA